MPRLAYNRRARWRFSILEKWEAGIELTGQEVKSVKNGRIDLMHAFVTVRILPARAKQKQKLSAVLTNCYIPKYERAGSAAPYDPRRPRQLLLRREQLKRMTGLLEQKGLTIVPLSMYTRNHLVKLEIGLARDKTEFDKRDTIRRRETDRQMRSAARRAVQHH